MFLLNSLAIVYRSSCRCISTSKRLASKRSHYEVLGITSQATQKDIKGAYFRLCMVHHPDQKGNKSHDQKFLEIQAAYEVLGNVRLRKLYDKGVNPIRPSPSSTSSPDPDLDPSAKFYRSRQNVTRPASSSSTPIYNFDEWTRAHYASTFKRDMERKKKTAFNQDLRKQEDDGLKSIQLVGVIGVFFFTILYMTYRTRNYDIVTVDETQRKELAVRGLSP